MTAPTKIHAGVEIIPTVIVRTGHTVLTEILNGKNLRRLAITEPKTGFKRRMHRHLRRDDYLYLLTGNVTLITYDGRTYAKIPMTPRGDVVLVPKGIWHGYEIGSERSVILEASSQAFDPTDVEEFQGKEQS